MNWTRIKELSSYIAIGIVLVSMFYLIAITGLDTSACKLLCSSNNMEYINNSGSRCFCIPVGSCKVFEVK